MRRYNISEIYKLGVAIGQVLHFKAGLSYEEMELPVKTLGEMAGTFARHPHLLFSQGFKKIAGQVEMQALKLFMEKAERFAKYLESGEPAQPVAGKPMEDLRELVRKLEYAFNVECDGLNVFSIQQVLAYDMAMLVERGERLIPEGLVPWLSPGHNLTCNRPPVAWHSVFIPRQPSTLLAARNPQ